jgi:peptidoglycan/LPS O-acetylase OafA/YrhL
LTADPANGAGTIPAIGRASTRVPIFDGLRGGMLILILFVHFRSLEEPTPGHWAEQIWHFTLDMAVFTLDTFFVLSGFLITRILLDSKHSPSFFRTFYVRRVLRIFPVYYAFLVIYFLILPNLAAWAAELRIAPLQHVFYWSHLTNIAAGLNDWLNPEMARSGYPFQYSTTHLWSLAVEEQFYALWPLAVYLCTTATFKRVCLACIVAAPVCRILFVATLGAESNAAYVMTPARMDGLAIGSLLAVCARTPEGLSPFVRWAWPVGAIGAAVLTALFFYEGGHINLEETVLFHTLGLTASVYVAAAIVTLSLVARERGVWHRITTSWPLSQAGKFSYAAYIIHLPLRYSLQWSGVLHRPARNSGLAAELAYSSTMIVLSLALAAVIWHVFEKHFLNLRRLVPYGLRRREETRA